MISRGPVSQRSETRQKNSMMSAMGRKFSLKQKGPNPGTGGDLGPVPLTLAQSLAMPST